MMKKTRKRARMEEKSGLRVKWETIMGQAHVFVSLELEVALEAFARGDK